LEVSIGIQLKELRQRAGLTQVQLAQAAGITQASVARYESDQKVPTGLRLASLARALKVPMEVIVGDQVHSEPIEHGPRLHGNSRGAKVQELFLQLDEEAQRVILKQMKALADAKPTTEHKRHKAA
jgi:transcriptional regulator with XRE-family HTH domain